MTYTNVTPSATHGPISLSNPDLPLDPGLLDAPGGFCWWYLDHVDEAGNGLVLIWSFGLPFLPGYLAAARAGHPEPAGLRPSLNLALYEDGKPSFYLLQEYPPDQVRWDGDAWRFGDSQLRLQAEGDRRRLTVDLDCPIPGSGDRLQGRIDVEGARTRFAPDAPGRSETHEWSPVVGPSRLEADLRIGETAHRRSGWAYHDRNGGTLPFDRLGIDRWTWGRWASHEGTRIYYVLWTDADDGEPTAWGVDLAPDGRATFKQGLEVSLEPAARARYGMLHNPKMVLHDAGTPWLEVTTRRIVDDGPFYLRTYVERGADGAIGMGEWVAPDRIDKDWQRPLVRMRVHRTGGGNSMWLPLFSGPVRGRIKRLMGLGGRPS